MWNIAQCGYELPDILRCSPTTQNVNTSRALKIFNKIIATINGLRQIRHRLFESPKQTINSDLLKKLIFIKGEMGRKPLTFTLLRNVPNTTFEQIFEELGPSLEDTIRYCKNAGMRCSNITKVHSALFPKCFVYATQENKTSNEVSDEGLDNGVSMVLMSGIRLAARAFTNYSNSIYRNPVFQNTWLPFSADGIRLIIHRPGVTPNIDQQGINLSPSQSTLIAITGKEVIRKPWPYSSRCTTTDYELEKLRKSVAQAMDQDSNSSITEEDDMSTYTQQDCRSACLQHQIWKTCNCLDIKARLPFSKRNNKLLCGALKEGHTEMLFNPEKHGTQDCIKKASELISNKCSYLHKIINDLACVKQVREEFTKRKIRGETGCICPSPCYSYQYISSISQASWPAPGPETHAAYRNLVDIAKWNFEGMDQFHRFVWEYCWGGRLGVIVYL